VSRNEDFDNAFWSQSAIEELSPQATLLYIWSWTNPRCGMAGIYEVGPKAMKESKVSVRHIQGALVELAAARLAFYVDGVLWVVARVKRLRTKTVQIAKSIAKDVEAISEGHDLRRRWLEFYGSTSWLRGSLEGRGLRLSGTSPEPHEILDAKPNVVNLTPTSPEVALSGPLSVGSTSSDNSKSFTRELFEYWQERCDHRSALLTAERKAKVEARLREGRTPEDIRKGIDGAARSPFISPEGKRFDDLELICRSGSKLEDFMGRSTPQQASGSALVERLNVGAA
jgi:hypothetical protein